MSIFSRILPLLLLTGSAQAATLSISGYQLVPHQQLALYAVTMGLGYPVGNADVGFILDCRSSKVTFLQLNTDGTQFFLGKPFKTAGAALQKAVLGSGLVTVKSGVFTLKATGSEPVVNQCQHGLLDAELLDSYVLGETRHLEVSVASQSDLDDSGGASSKGGSPAYNSYSLSLKLDASPMGKAGFSVDGFFVNRETYGPLPLPNAQVMVSDGKALYPIFYAGLSQDNASLSSLTVPSTVTVYSTLDGKIWNKTSINLAKRRVQTVPATKPKLPVRS